VWEPSDEAEIESVANVYISKGLVHEPGFRYAINIDPAMFEVNEVAMLVHKAQNFVLAGLLRRKHRKALHMVIEPHSNNTGCM
jgi:hypothetical protein